jgi:hypothetical protein
MTGPVLFALIVVTVVLILAGAGVLEYRRVYRRRRRRPGRRALRGVYRGPDGRVREWMLWVGDGMAPAGPDLIGRPINIDGRTGRVVDATALTILVEWDHAA